MMTVSSQTEKFIKCMNTMQMLYTQVYTALEETYLPEDCEAIMADHFIEAFDALEKRVESLVMMSIKDKMGSVDTTEI